MRHYCGCSLNSHPSYERRIGVNNLILCTPTVNLKYRPPFYLGELFIHHSQIVIYAWPCRWLIVLRVLSWILSTIYGVLTYAERLNSLNYNPIASANHDDRMTIFLDLRRLLRNLTQHSRTVSTLVEESNNILISDGRRMGAYHESQRLPTPRYIRCGVFADRMRRKFFSYMAFFRGYRQ